MIKEIEIEVSIDTDIGTEIEIHIDTDLGIGIDILHLKLITAFARGRFFPIYTLATYPRIIAR
jgi:hypothetical protein